MVGQCGRGVPIRLTAVVYAGRTGFCDCVRSIPRGGDIVLATHELVGLADGSGWKATGPVRVAPVELFGVPAWLAFRPDETEWARRGGSPLSCLPALDVLDVLMELPYGAPIAKRSLPAADRRVLTRSPSGGLEPAGPSVIRRLVPPLTPLLVMVKARRWQSGLNAASRFASYCSRMALVPNPPAESTAFAEASFFGVGLAAGAAGDRQILLEPEPLADWQPTPAWWRFTEWAYRQVVTGTG